MKYFAYGSNMSSKRLRKRVPGAKSTGVCSLAGFTYRIDKVSKKDGSGKSDIRETGNPQDFVYGVLFEIADNEIEMLDSYEEYPKGYDRKEVTVTDHHGNVLTAVTYIARETTDGVKPFSWYMNHVVIGAKRHKLPDEYITMLESIETIEDENRERDIRERAIYD